MDDRPRETSRQRRITVLDGGMGRELMRIGAPFRQPEWSALALWDGPDRVIEAHANFVRAGAEVITTNSYAIVPFHIGDERFDAEARALAHIAGRLANEARSQLRAADENRSRPVRIAGSLPPLFGSYRPDLFRAVDAPRILDPLVAGLCAHVDLWLAETLGCIDEAVAVRAGLVRAGSAAMSKDLWVSFALDDDGPVLRSGESVVDAAWAAVDLGATAVLFNCSRAEVIGAAIAEVSAVVDGSAELGGYANRFAGRTSDDGEDGQEGDETTAHGHGANEALSALRDDLSPEHYRTLVTRWLDDGATIIGGCCGMTPDHIAALAAAVTRR